MPNPKKRRSTSKQGKMRTHKKLLLPTFTNCPQCGEPKLPHRVCTNCGTYKGREIIEVE